jgi:peptidoglycan/xylan/chitin deacetylase (PgdA/CDA1 family)
MILCRSQVAKVVHRIGLTNLVAIAAQSPSLIVLCYHRIGRAEKDVYDPNVYSATAEEFDDQIGYLKRLYGIVTVDEVLTGYVGRPWRGARILVTFDDGYLDNYSIAYPILRAHGVQGTFLLATDFVGTGNIPWWDAICHMIISTPQRYIRVPSLTAQVFDKLAEGPERIGRRVLKLFAATGQPNPHHVIKELEASTGISCSPLSSRRFLNWEEAREMQRQGMEIGGHTISHRLLGCLHVEEQRAEIAGCRELIAREMGAAPRVFALPCGNCSPETADLVRAAGFSLSLSTQHGVNRIDSWDTFNVRRVQVNREDVTETARLRLALLSGGVNI